MNLNTYSKPEIYINDIEIEEYSGFSINCAGASQLNTATVSGVRKDLTDFHTMHQELVIYLNEGSNDSIPIFRGFIKGVNPSASNLSIEAKDPRVIIAGKEAFPVIIDEYQNYDGNTLVQFIYKYIDEKINTDKVIIGLDMLSETSPKLLMKGFRTGVAVPYQVMQDALSQAVDITDIENPVDYEFIMIDDGVKSNIVIQNKRILKNTTPSVSYDFIDGIQNIKYSKKPLPTFALVKGEDDIQAEFQHGNMAAGKSGITVTGPYENRAEARLAGLLEIMRLQDEYTEITLQVNKGFHVGIGSIINIYIDSNVNDSFELSSNHRVVSKNISFSTKAGATMSLKLNRKPLKMSSFLF